MEILKVEELTKVYGSKETEVVALNHINFSVNEGEFVSIIGPSGSGKSTLLHMLGGVDHPTSGKVYIEGTDISSFDETKMALFRRKQVGLIYQAFNLIPTLDVEKNILLPMLLDHRLPNKDEFEKLLEMLGLQERRKHMPSQLSGGQKQRVAIGRSLIYKPSIILADEPTGNLDRKNSIAILNLLKESNKKRNQTIIMITHDEEIAKQADRMIKIIDGKIVSDEVIG